MKQQSFKLDPYKLFELSLKQLGFSGFQREYLFSPSRKWRIDFAWPDKYLAVEIEGGTWSNHSRHTRGSGYLKDIEKYNMLTLCGFHLLRFIPKQIQNGEALGIIEQWFRRQERVN